MAKVTTAKKKTVKAKKSTVPVNVAVMRTITVPSIGALWPDQGGYYAGIVKGDEGKPDYHLIVHADDGDSFNWKKGMDWAAKLKADGHADFSLPTRREQRLLFCNAKHLFQEYWYWSSEAHAVDSDYAWFQSFGSGYQSDVHKSINGRVRAVRRIKI